MAPNNTIVYDPKQQCASEPMKILATVIGVFLTSCATFILVAVVFHAIRLAKISRRFDEFQRNYSVKKSKYKNATMLSKWLGRLSLLAAACAFMNCASDHALLYLKKSSDTTCKVMQSFNFIFYSFGVAGVYSFLWVRQRVFYSSPSLREMHGKYIRRISTAILPVFACLMVVGLCCTIAVWNFETSDCGCVETSQSRVPMILLFLGSVSMQGALLGLFVFPLKQHTAFINGVSVPSDEMVVKLVKRTFLITGVCILADLTAFIIVMSLPRTVPFIAINLAYDGNLIVNVICIVCSFVDWRSRLGLCCGPEIPLEQNFKRATSERESRMRLKMQSSTSQSNSQSVVN